MLSESISGFSKPQGLTRVQADVVKSFMQLVTDKANSVCMDLSIFSSEYDALRCARFALYYLFVFNYNGSSYYNNARSVFSVAVANEVFKDKSYVLGGDARAELVLQQSIIHAGFVHPTLLQSFLRWCYCYVTNCKVSSSDVPKYLLEFKVDFVEAVKKASSNSNGGVFPFI